MSFPTPSARRLRTQDGYLLAVLVDEDRLRVRPRADGIQHVEVLRDQQQVDDVLGAGALDLLVAREVADGVLEAVDDGLALARDADAREVLGLGLRFRRLRRRSRRGRARTFKRCAVSFVLCALSRGLQRRLAVSRGVRARARASLNSACFEEELQARL